MFKLVKERKKTCLWDEGLSATIDKEVTQFNDVLPELQHAITQMGFNGNDLAVVQGVYGEGVKFLRDLSEQEIRKACQGMPFAKVSIDRMVKEKINEVFNSIPVGDIDLAQGLKVSFHEEQGAPKTPGETLKEVCERLSSCHPNCRILVGMLVMCKDGRCHVDPAAVAELKTKLCEREIPQSMLADADTMMQCVHTLRLLAPKYKLTMQSLISFNGDRPLVYNAPGILEQAITAPEEPTLSTVINDLYANQISDIK